jgi:hypothetical protein
MTQGGTMAERWVRQSMSVEEIDEYYERRWKTAQRRQKLDPSGSKRKTAEGFAFGRFIPHCETVADFECQERDCSNAGRAHTSPCHRLIKKSRR